MPISIRLPAFWHLWIGTPRHPAREVGGDFYDFLTLPDGRLGIIVADVTDKGVPAALVMATTRSILHGATQRLASPGAVLERTNELLCPDIPSNTLVAEYPNPGGDGAKLIRFLLSELARFTGDGWEQDDDITLVTLRRCVSSTHSVSLIRGTSEDNMTGVMGDDAWRILDEWTVPSEPGNERPAMERVGEVVRPLHLPPQRLERLKTAVSEATMNAIEHGNQSRPELPVVITVLASERVLAVRVTDQGGHRPIHDPETPDLEAKLEGRQTPRGWGLFLIKKLVDDVRVSGDDAQRTVELLLYREGDAHASKTL